MSFEAPSSGGDVARHRIAILDDYLRVALDAADWEPVRRFADIEVFDRRLDRDELVARLADVDVLCVMRERTPLPADLLGALPNLRLIASTAMKNASIDLDAATRQGIVVCGTRAYTHPTIEMTWALILAFLRRIPENQASLRAGRWQAEIGRAVRGARLGVIGLGNNGSQVARIGAMLGMDVVAWSQNLTDETAAEVGVRRVSKEELLRSSEVVTIHLRLSERTWHLLGTDELALLRPDALLVNTSRGEIVDQDALIEVLQGGRIAGAALDVYDEEPLPAGHPLADLPNVLLSPHLGYVTRDTMQLFFGDTVENIVAFHEGAPVRVMNPEVLERKG